MEQLLAAAEGVVAVAGQSIDACPNFGSGDDHGDVCDGLETVAEHADVTRRHDRMRTAVRAPTELPRWLRRRRHRGGRVGLVVLATAAFLLLTRSGSAAVASSRAAASGARMAAGWDLWRLTGGGVATQTVEYLD